MSYIGDIRGTLTRLRTLHGLLAHYEELERAVRASQQYITRKEGDGTAVEYLLPPEHSRKLYKALGQLTIYKHQHHLPLCTYTEPTTATPRAHRY